MITPIKQGEERFRLTFLPTWLLVGATDRPFSDAAEVINGGCDKCNKALAQAATMPGFEIEGIYCGHCGRLRRGPVLTPFERLAEAAEHLLAEYGATEPGAGADNHEGPAGAALDALYGAWNQYMRAMHGTPDAVFEPEGMADRRGE
jgi:hypothetical protein